MQQNIAILQYFIHVQYNMADLGYRYIVYHSILLNIASASNNLNAKCTKMN